MNFYKRHLGDYAKSAGHLSMMEHGAYTLLLDRYYATELPLPAQDVYRIARCRSANEKTAVDIVLKEFFLLAGDGWRKGRVEEEIGKANAQAATNRLIAEQRETRKRERLEHESLNESLNESFTSVHREACSLREPSQTPDSRQEQKQDQKTAPKGDLFPGIDPQIVADFKSLRNKQRAPITQTALAGIQREADKAGLSLEAALRTCCENSWRGFKAVWITDAGTNNSRTGHVRKLSIVEQVAAANAEWEERERIAAAT